MIALTLERPTVQMHTRFSHTCLLTHSDTHARTQALYFVVKLVAKKTKVVLFFFFLISHTLIVITCREDALLFLPYAKQGRCTSSRGDVGLQLLLARIELSLELLGFGMVLELGV